MSTQRNATKTLNVPYKCNVLEDFIKWEVSIIRTDLLKGVSFSSDIKLRTRRRGRGLSLPPSYSYGCFFFNPCNFICFGLKNSVFQRLFYSFNIVKPPFPPTPPHTTSRLFAVKLQYSRFSPPLCTFYLKTSGVLMAYLAGFHQLYNNYAPLKNQINFVVLHCL